MKILIIIILILISFLSCKKCIVEVWQGGVKIDENCEFCSMSKSSHGSYYKNTGIKCDD